MKEKNDASFEPDLNQRPMDISASKLHKHRNTIYSPPLYQLSYRRGTFGGVPKSDCWMNDGRGAIGIGIWRGGGFTVIQLHSCYLRRH
ncbi:GL16407 [Drosophila persimilis]|uniref:GL16407 n=1 Tax=Drosophila persimilis TaxID=7234 RepID=B4GWM3_DROPE|nr:GL16407 [Drosophila persimilis]